MQENTRSQQQMSTQPNTFLYPSIIMLNWQKTKKTNKSNNSDKRHSQAGIISSGMLEYKLSQVLTFSLMNAHLASLISV